MFSSNTQMIPRTDLTDDRIAYLAPSVFASQPAEGVSDRYTFLPTSQILSRMRAEGWAPVEARQQAVRAEGRIGFQKHLLRFQRAELIAKAGEFTPELILTNSHDRSSAYVVAAGLWRFVCSNGLMVADSTVASIHIRHSGRETEEVLQASFTLFASIDKIAGMVERFKSRILTPGERQDFAQKALALRWETAPISTTKLLVPSRQHDNGQDLWTTFNVAQEHLMRGGQKDYSIRQENGRRLPRTRPVNGLDQGIKINTQLWDLAASYCQN